MFLAHNNNEQLTPVPFNKHMHIICKDYVAFSIRFSSHGAMLPPTTRGDMRVCIILSKSPD